MSKVKQIQQSVSAPTTVTNKDYIKKMLLSKLNRRFFGLEDSPSQLKYQKESIINNEVLQFIRTQKLNRESLKGLETNIESKIQGLSNKKPLKQIKKTESQHLQIKTDLYEDKNLQQYKTYDQQEFSLPQIGLKQQDIQNMKQQTPKKRENSIKSQLSNEDEWAELNKYKQLQYDRDNWMSKQRKENQIKEFKSTLDQQIKEKQQKFKQIKQIKINNDNMVLNQVAEYKKLQDKFKIDQNRKMLNEKQIRQFQINEIIDKKKWEKKSKQEYEKELVDTLKMELKQEEERQIKKKEDYISLAQQMQQENQKNKQMQLDEKRRLKELDVKLAHDYVKMVEDQEQKKVEQFKDRERRIQNFMTKMEKSVIQQENKKLRLLEENVVRYEQKRERKEWVDEEKRKKYQSNMKNELKDCLRDQIVEKNQKKELNKQINNEYVKWYREKIERDQQQEQRQVDEIKKKQQEVQDFNKKQIEMKSFKKRGMSEQEFQINRDLLSEIIDKKEGIRKYIRMNEAQSSQKKVKQIPAYQIYEM